MSDTLVKVEGVSKKFCRDLKRSLWYGMKDLGNELLGRRHGGNGELRKDEFWAVKEVSFEMKRGECLGLIGQNGAGKTTLLRMLNGLIKPDQGRIEMRGRVGALIALGAGFNPILTGRENIYVNASVLGLSKREIDGKIDEIIDFAEIGEFIDSPVQSYSSGMAVRLGFAIATAIKPDVLLLDEVLAVGDASFRAKCYHRISALLEETAVVLVSHNIDQIGQICSNSIVMHYGKCNYQGDVTDGVKFFNRLAEARSMKFASEVYEYTSAGVQILSRTVNESVDYGNPLSFIVRLKLARQVQCADFKLTIFSILGDVVAEAYTKPTNRSISLKRGVVDFNIVVGPILLKENTYVASIVILDRQNNEHLYWGSRIFEFRVNGPAFGSGSFIVPIDVVSSQ